jgi:hypothetical protein
MSVSPGAPGPWADAPTSATGCQGSGASVTSPRGCWPCPASAPADARLPRLDSRLAGRRSASPPRQRPAYRSSFSPSQPVPRTPAILVELPGGAENHPGRLTSVELGRTLGQAGVPPGVFTTPCAKARPASDASPFMASRPPLFLKLLANDSPIRPTDRDFDR